MRNFKKFSLLFVVVTALLACPKVFAADYAIPQTRPQTNQTFTFDYEFKLRLEDELTKSVDGKNYIVPIVGYKTTEYLTTETVDLSSNDAVHYKVTEITEEQYNELKAYQDQIDAYDLTVIKDNNSTYATDENISKLEEYIKTNKWWCYDSFNIGEIKLPAGCETKYYIVTVDAMDENYLETAFNAWNKHTTRVYKVDANTDLEACQPTEDKTDEENPKTGISTPYIICGALVLGSIIAIVVSKKEKFM